MFCSCQLITDANVATSSANDFDIVGIPSGPSGAVIGTKLASATVPLLIGSRDASNANNLGPLGATITTFTWNVLNISHPIAVAAGLTLGTNSMYSSARVMSDVTPCSSISSSVMARITGGAASSSTFVVYDIGQTMCNSFVAPHVRIFVGFPTPGAGGPSSTATYLPSATQVLRSSIYYATRAALFLSPITNVTGNTVHGFMVLLINIYGSRVGTDSTTQLRVDLTTNAAGASVVSGNNVITVSQGRASFTGLLLDGEGSLTLTASCVNSERACRSAVSSVFTSTLTTAPTITSFTVSGDWSDAEYGFGDVFVLSFSAALFPTDVSTTAAINQLFSFSSSIGTAYLGTWATGNTQIVITVLDPASSAPSIGSVTVTARALTSVYLWNAARTSRKVSDTSPALTGSFGSGIASFVASGPAGTQVYAAGCQVTITFTIAVTAVAVTNKAQIDTAFTFSSSIGTAYSGVWSGGNTVLTITIDTAAGIDPGIGFTTVTALSSVIGSGSTLSPFLSGTWGSGLLAAPTIVSFVAADPSNADDVFGAGDTLTITFSAAVTAVAVSTKAALDALLMFSPALGPSYTGAWAGGNTQLVVTLGAGSSVDPGIGACSVQVRDDGGVWLTNAAGTSRTITSISPVLTGSWGSQAAAPQVVSFVASGLASSDAVYGAGDVLTITFSQAVFPVAVGTKADIDALIFFSHPIATDYSGAFAAGNTQLVITLLDVSTTAEPPIGSVNGRISDSPVLLRNAAQTSAAIRARFGPLTGNWGSVLAAPTVLSLVALDDDNADTVYSVGDSIVLTFSEAVFPVAVGSTSAVDALLSFSSAIGTAYSGAFSNSNTQLVITISAMTAIAPVIGSLTVTIRTDGGVLLRNAAQTSASMSSTSPVLSGNWGLGLAAMMTASGLYAGGAASSEWFGCAVSSVIDMNGDGVGDLAVGACGSAGSIPATSGVNQGSVQLLFLAGDVSAGGGSAEGPTTVVSSVKIPAAGSTLQNELNTNADSMVGGRFGTAVCALGDVNGDGTVDLAVGAPFDHNGGVRRGALYILLLNSAGGVLSWSKIASSAMVPLSNGDYMGMSCSTLGDMDGDGVTELAVGAPQSDGSSSTGTGYIIIMFLNSAGGLKGATRITNADDGSGSGAGAISALSSGDEFGWSLALIGGTLSVNGTQMSLGAADDIANKVLAVGAPGHAASASALRQGAVYLVFLSAAGISQGFQHISSGMWGTSSKGLSGRSTVDGVGFAGSLKAGDRFGSSVSMAGDVNGDGVLDLLVGAPRSSGGISGASVRP